MNLIKNQVLFKPLPSDEFTVSGLFIPLTCREVNNKGVLMKVGKGTNQREMKLKEGMIAYRVLNWGEEIIIEGEQYFLMDANAIIAIE